MKPGLPVQRLSRPPENPPEEKGADWGRFLGAVLRYRWAVLAVTVFGGAAGFGISKFILPQYRAQATVWVETLARGGDERGPFREDPMLAATSWTDLLKSYVVLDEVIRETRRYLSVGSRADLPAFAGFAVDTAYRPGSYRLKVAKDGKTVLLETRQGMPVEQTNTGDSVGRSIGFRWIPQVTALRPGRTISFAVLTPRDAAQELTDHLKPVIDQRGTFVRVELVGSDPEETAGTLNALVQRFVGVAADLKRTKLTELTTILSDQLNVAQRNLKAAELALEDFRVKTITLPSERASPVAPGLQITQDPVMTGFFDMRIQQEQLRRDREAIAAALANRGDSTAGLTGLALVTAVTQNADLTRALDELNTRQADLRTLLYRYTEETPAVQRLRSEVATLQTQTIPRLANTLISSIRQRERELDDRIGALSKDLRQIPPRVIEEARLVRDVAIAENLYTTLQARFEEARLAEASSIPDLRILDRAFAPEKPFKNSAPQVIVIGLLGSLGLAVLGSIMLDRGDRSVRFPEQVSIGMGLPILGSVPRAETGSRGNGEGAQAVIEGLRGIRLNLAHAQGGIGPCVFTVTSPAPGDGKSFVASNLALAFADGGYNTLLIDGDLRRGGLHRLLDAKRKPGVTDYLSGAVGADRLVQSTSHASLRFIGCGTWMQKAPELLGSSSMSQLLTQLRGEFSVIVVDSPPLGVGIDPLVWGTVTGNVVVVLRTGVTDREVAAARIDLLDRLPLRVLGAVLNDVRAGGSYQNYGYTPGYYVKDEEARLGDGRQLKKGTPAA